MKKIIMKALKILSLLLIIFLIANGTIGALWNYIVVNHKSDIIQNRIFLFPFGVGGSLVCFLVGMILIPVHIMVFHTDWFVSDLKRAEDVFLSAVSNLDEDSDEKKRN